MVAKLNVEPDEIIEGKKPKAKTSKLKPASLGRKMTDDEFQGLVYTWSTDARNYVDEFVALERERATNYYKGRLPDVDLDDAEEDRSRAVLSEVRDTVLGIMPDLLRIFFSADGVVRYNPAPAEDPQKFAQHSAYAKQATEYVRDVVLKVDNPEIFIEFHSAFQDALVRKTGFMKWWWEKSKKPLYSTHTGLTEDQVMALASSDDVEIMGKRGYVVKDATSLSPVVQWDIQIKRIQESGRARIKAIPCENVIVARRGTSIDRTSLFGFTEDKKVGDFLAEGFIDDPAELDDCDKDSEDDDNLETQARRPELSTQVGPADDPADDPSQRVVKYGEIYITADRDGDGIPELIRVITAGIGYKVLREEPVDDVDYAAFCPYPEAHQFFGDSVADLTEDVQRIKSRILRDVLDSLAQSVQPQLGIVEGQVNLDDVLNPDTSKVIRQRQPGMIQPITIPFVGGDGLPILDFMTKVRENRTGQSDASNGLDPGVLQSSTQSAVHATLSKSQSRVEMIARIFAETGMTRLFRGLLKLIIKNCDTPRMAMLGGSPALVDPRHWNAEMTCEATLALGRGSQNDQTAALTAILGKQEQVLMMLGPENPVCSLDQYCYTLAKLVELAGWQNTTSFFGDTSKLDPQAKQQAMDGLKKAMAAKAGAGKSGPDPQIEQAKIASNEKIETMKLQLAQAKMHGEMMLEAMKTKANLQLEAMKILSEHSQAMDQSRVDALVEHAGNQMDAHVQHIGNHIAAHVQHRGNVMDNTTKLAIAQLQPAEGTGDDGQ